MSAFKSLILAFSIFSRIPMPKAEWTQKNMRYLLACFPLVGAAIGLMLMGWGKFAVSVKLSRMLFACGLTLIPIAFTGGIHMDGLCATANALTSHAAPEKKSELLEQKTVSSFSAISLVCYLLLYFSLCYEIVLSNRSLALLICIHVVSRILCSFSIVMLPSDDNSSALSAFAESVSKTAVYAALAVMLFACEVTALAISPLGGCLILLNGAVCFLLLKRMTQNDFKGLHGSMIGFFLQMNELVSVACIIISQKVNFI